MPRHFADDQQRQVPQLALLASLDGNLGALRQRRLVDQLGDQLGHVLAVDVEVVLPEHAAHRQPAQLLLIVTLETTGTFSGIDRGGLAYSVKRRHNFPPEMIREQKEARHTSQLKRMM